MNISLEHKAQLAKNNQRLFAARVSLVVGAAIMIVKFLAFRLTSSEAILSDALESIVNVISAAIVLLTIGYAMKPADKDHPYGHGKMEFFSAAFEGGLVSFAAVFIIIESISAILYGHEVYKVGQGIIMILVAGVANLALGSYLVRRGKALQSIALQSSGQHVLSDVWTSLGLLLGLVATHLTGWLWLDAAIATGFGVYLAHVGYGIVVKAAGGLMDKEDPDILKKIAAVLKPHTMNGVIDIHELKVIRSGRYHHIDMHIVLPGHWTIEQSHARVQQFESAVMGDYLFDGEMHFHYEPCRRSFCALCDLDDCSHRLALFQAQNRVPVQIRQSQSKDRLDDV